MSGRNKNTGLNSFKIRIKGFFSSVFVCSMELNKESTNKKNSIRWKRFKLKSSSIFCIDSLEKKINNLAKKIASEIHEDRKKLRNYEPRWKKTKDKQWESKIQAKLNLKEGEQKGSYRLSKEGVFELDIANLKFEELPSDWQNENYEAVKVVAKLVLEAQDKNQKIDEEWIHNAASVCHAVWIERNPWVKEPAEKGSNSVLAQPFNKLPKNEQEKDIAQVKLGLKVLGLL